MIRFRIYLGYNLKIEIVGGLDVSVRERQHS